MNVQEFSVEFDVLYNNIKSTIGSVAPGVDEYEKSVFLTKAQEEIVKTYFNPTSNKLQQGFDSSEKRQIDFSELIKVSEISQNISDTSYTSIDDRAVFFKYPQDTFIIVNEQVTIQEGNKFFIATVIPMNYREYDMLMSKPYKEPLKRQCWRFIQSNSQTPINANGATMVSEIVTKSGTTVDKYRVRYVKKPQPIILANLDIWDLSINGVTTPSECELNPIIHREILDRAVEMAKIHYEAGDPGSIVQINERNN